MSDVSDMIAGVTEALATAGRDMTLRRTVTVRNPADPTGPGTVTTTDYSCRAYVGPVSSWDANSRMRVVTTDAYIDPLSIAGNTAEQLTVISDLGDILIDDAGREWILTREQHPYLLDRIGLFWHSGIA